MAILSSDLRLSPPSTDMAGGHAVSSKTDGQPPSRAGAGAGSFLASGSRQERFEVVGVSGKRGGTTVEMLRQHFHLPLNSVASMFGMCTTAFKKMCRRLGIPKWPHRQLRGIDKKIAALKAELGTGSDDKKQLNSGLAALEENKARLSGGPPGNADAAESGSESSRSSGWGSSARSLSAKPSFDKPAPHPLISREACGTHDNDSDDGSGGDMDTVREESCERENASNVAPVGSIVVTQRELRNHFHLPLNSVASKFGMCTTAFKKMCRRFGIAKWPHRKLRGIDKRIAALRAELKYAKNAERILYEKSLSALEREKQLLVMGPIENGSDSLGSASALSGSAPPDSPSARSSPALTVLKVANQDSSSRRVEIQNLLCEDVDELEDDELEDEEEEEGVHAAGSDTPPDSRKVEETDREIAVGSISQEVLRKHFHLALHIVANKFGICTTAFKKMCRRFGIAKWPHRKLRGIDKKIAALKAELKYAKKGDTTYERSLAVLEQEKAELSGSVVKQPPMIDTKLTQPTEAFAWPEESALDHLAKVAGMISSSQVSIDTPPVQRAHFDARIYFETAGHPLAWGGAASSAAHLKQNQLNTPPMVPLTAPLPPICTGNNASSADAHAMFRNR